MANVLGFKGWDIQRRAYVIATNLLGSYARSEKVSA